VNIQSLSSGKWGDILAIRGTTSDKVLWLNVKNFEYLGKGLRTENSIFAPRGWWAMSKFPAEISEISATFNVNNTIYTWCEQGFLWISAGTGKG
jgi:hypothetical protein